MDEPFSVNDVADEKVEIKWLAECEEQDYPAAASFLGLIYDDVTVKAKVGGLQRSPLSKFKAKDILRASGLKPLADDNEHVRKDLKKIKDGKEMSPMLLVRDPQNGKVIVADGYHRVSAVYAFGEDEWIPCKIV
jgi:hypothetical protein